MSDDLGPDLKDVLVERGRVDSDTVDRVLVGIDELPARRAPRWRGTGAVMAAVVSLAVVGLAVVALLRPAPDVATAPTASPTATLAASPTTPAGVSPEVTPTPRPTLQPRPVWAIELVSHLDCDGLPSTIGSDTETNAEPIDPGDTPAQALDNFLIDLPTVPMSGYTPPLVDGHWALHRYLVDGRPKVHAVSTNQFPTVPSETRWQVVGFRACDPSEFAEADFGSSGATIWRDADDHPVRSDVITSYAGPGHCGWQRTVFLSLGPDHTQYIRDPQRDLAEQTLMRFRADGPMPDDAVDSGYHTDQWHLFTIPSGRAVFMRTPDGRVERWPRATDPIGCA